MEVHAGNAQGYTSYCNGGGGKAGKGRESVKSLWPSGEPTSRRSWPPPSAKPCYGDVVNSTGQHVTRSVTLQHARRSRERC